jgi:AGCS family alanine or glycine:cation symporter
MTSLAATIGIGSIAGMATAITAGGYGAIFWMWVVALIGMITKYSEAILAVKYRKSDSKGRMKGGPMYYIEQGLKMKWLAVLFAVFGLLSSFAGGNLIQAQSIADASLELFNIPPIVTGIIVAVCVAATLFGGVKKLGKINSFLVPIMALLYIVGGLIVLVLCHDKILDAISLIFSNAFSGRSVTGGLLGAGVMSSVQMGVARGISSNEAGLGSGPIASAAAKTDYPGRQALISMSAVFISSFIVCTITVLVLSVTNMVGKVSDNGQILNGAPLVMQSFESVLPGGGVIVALGLLLFGFSTILGWSYYGEKCMEFLFNGKGIVLFRLIFICLVFVGSLLSINVVWPLADIMNGLMAFPNLIGVLFLAKVVSKESDSFFRLLRTERKVIQSYE